MASSETAKGAAESWLRSVGISWDEKAVEIRQGPPSGGDDNEKHYSGVGLGVWALKDIKEGDTLCNIPKSALLSIRNTEVSDIIEEENLGGGLGLVFAVLYEMSIGEKSKWHGYFLSMPSREYLPIFWNDDELALLKGTELEERAVADRELARGDYDQNVAPLLKKYADRLPSSMTYEKFTCAASLVASRAFGVDEWHGESMVPLADIFNHKASIVSLSEEYMIAEEAIAAAIEQAGAAGDGGGDEEEGQVAEEGEGEGEDEEDGGEDEDDDDDGDDEDTMVLFSGGLRPPPILNSAGDDGTAGALRLEIGICSDEDKDELQIIAASGVVAGAEVHNTYGEHGNAELVCKYGFALRENPFECIVLEKSSLVDAADHEMSKKSAKTRTGFLLEHTALLDDDVEPFEVLAGGRLGAALVAALHVMGAPATEFKSWKGVQEAFPWMKEEDGDDGEAEEEGEEGEEAPAWTETGVLQLGDSAGADGGGSSALTAEARAILARMLEGEYERKFGSQGIEEDEAQLADAERQPLESSSNGSRCNAAALRAVLTLRLGEKKVIKDALAALGLPGDKVASGGDGGEHEGPSSKRAKAS